MEFKSRLWCEIPRHQTGKNTRGEDHRRQQPSLVYSKDDLEDIFGCNTIDSQPKHEEAGYYIDITGDCNSTQKCEDS